MIKQKTVLEVKIGDRVYEMFCESDSPLGELHDALMQMKSMCIEKIMSVQYADQSAQKQEHDQPAQKQEHDQEHE